MSPHKDVLCFVYFPACVVLSIRSSNLVLMALPMDHIEEIRSGHGFSIPYMSSDVCSVHTTSDLVDVPAVDMTGHCVVVGIPVGQKESRVWLEDMHVSF